MAWILLAVTILLEVAGTISMKLSNGLTKLVPSIGIFVFYGFCFAIFALVVKKIDLSIAYAIWSGVGTMLVFVVGVLVFKESFSWIKLLSILLIIAGVIGLKVSDTEDEPHSVVQPVQQIDVE
ncbi:multidrug efflux SMR transporter [Bacillus sp. FJAT-47783]|uniref:DMT family transporter n=1 Tax=Bacillus sp. FJAT-47783 TaxID=2922712 RepID=UPI001FAD8FDD|nr:multidrug efflux SMR transporter [Bacillus sp. FJAT-47783]